MRNNYKPGKASLPYHIRKWIEPVAAPYHIAKMVGAITCPPCNSKLPVPWADAVAAVRKDLPL
ncbi:hypothetical protein GCM10023184_18640 [Flaviaesturariibacter amylovorans]|uniref:Uncharacterized protein n=1 Tax=Flaviaesturariibacter amylovorans TaxID=1084520 RepID=A0ABP8GRH9_9BACT